MQFPYIETFFAFLFVPSTLGEVCFSIISLPVDFSMKTNLTLISQTSVYKAVQGN